MNDSSIGAARSTTTDSNDTTRIYAGNTANGYIARYINIRPGSDGDMLVTVDGNKPYLNAMMLKDEMPVVSFEGDMSTVPEDGRQLDLTVSLNHPAVLPVTVLCQVQEGNAQSGVDYSLLTPQLEFAMGQQEATVSLRILEDTEIESDEYLTLTVSGTGVLCGEYAMTTVFIEDNDLNPAIVVGFKAYNDFSWGGSQLSEKITRYTTDTGAGVPPDGSSGPLINYRTGAQLPVTLSVTGGSWDGSAHITQGSDSDGGTDAEEVFDAIVSCQGVMSYGSAIQLTITGLDPAHSYELVLFGNRDYSSYTDRTSLYTLNGADSYVNASTPGSTINGASTTIVTGYNTANGYVARYKDINPGSDGQISVTIGGNKPYLNAMMLSEARDIAVAFQNNQAPCTKYDRTRDAKIMVDAPTQNFGEAANLEIDGSPDYGSLLWWDIRSIPSGSTVKSASLTLWVSDSSTDYYELYGLKKAWREGEATWTQAANGLSWQTPGAQGSEDCGADTLGTFCPATAGEWVTVNLNAEGVALLQQWVDNPALNLGLIIKDYAGASHNAAFASSEHETSFYRPKLSVNYRPADDKDTDGDGLPDWWELAYFGNLTQSAWGNYDGDENGSNIDEYYGTGGSPATGGTSQEPGSGTPDPESPGSVPTDDDDEGDDENCLKLSLTVGDPSDSASEYYMMTCKPKSEQEGGGGGGEDTTDGSIIHPSLEGCIAPETESYSFVKGKAYEVTVSWLRTRSDYVPPGPDYDFVAKIDGKPGVCQEWIYGDGYAIHDESGLLGDYIDGGQHANSGAQGIPDYFGYATVKAELYVGKIVVFPIVCVATTTWPGANEALIEFSKIGVDVRPIPEDADIAVEIDRVEPDDPPTGDGSLSHDTAEPSHWVYQSFAEEKAEKHPVLKRVYFVAKINGHAIAAEHANIQSVFDFLAHPMRGLEDRDYAWQYAEWKYDISTAALESVRYDPGLPDRGKTRTDIGEESICTIGPEAFDSENWCASTLGHENVHGGQSFVYQYTQPKAAEADAYGWELSHAAANGLSEQERMEVQNSFNACFAP